MSTNAKEVNGRTLSRRQLYEELSAHDLDVRAFYVELDGCRKRLGRKDRERHPGLARRLLLLYKIAGYTLDRWDPLNEDVHGSFREDAALIYEHDPSLFCRLRLSPRDNLLRLGERELTGEDLVTIQRSGLLKVVRETALPSESVAEDQRVWREAAQFGHLDLSGLRQNSVPVPDLRRLDVR